MDPVRGKGGRNGEQTAKVESKSLGGASPPVEFDSTLAV